MKSKLLCAALAFGAAAALAAPAGAQDPRDLFEMSAPCPEPLVMPCVMAVVDRVQNLVDDPSVLNPVCQIIWHRPCG